MMERQAKKMITTEELITFKMKRDGITRELATAQLNVLLAKEELRKVEATERLAERSRK